MGRSVTFEARKREIMHSLNYFNCGGFKWKGEKFAADFSPFDGVGQFTALSISLNPRDCILKMARGRLK